MVVQVEKIILTKKIFIFCKSDKYLSLKLWPYARILNDCIQNIVRINSGGHSLGLKIQKNPSKLLLISSNIRKVGVEIKNITFVSKTRQWVT